MDLQWLAVEAAEVVSLPQDWVAFKGPVVGVTATLEVCQVLTPQSS